MPYVKSHRRNFGENVADSDLDTPGDLNYQITELLISYCERNGLSYQKINDCMGACRGAAAEFYRRVAAPYENQKIAENGDVYPEWMITSPKGLGR